MDLWMYDARKSPRSFFGDFKELFTKLVYLIIQNKPFKIPTWERAWTTKVTSLECVAK